MATDAFAKPELSLQPHSEIRQLLVDASGCQGPLDDGEALLRSLREATAAVGARERGGYHAAYVPHGLTAVILLAESHMTISTWPEYAFAMVDILFCTPSTDPEQAWQTIAETLRPREVRMNLVTRRVGA